MVSARAGGRQIVVAGGSFAGITAAYALRRRLDPTDEVTLVSPTDYFVFSPSLVWAALGKSMQSATFALEPALLSKGIRFVRGRVSNVDPTQGCLAIDGESMHFDRLVVATGTRVDAHAIPGLGGEFRAASCVVGEDTAMETRNAVRRLVESPGPVVVGVAPGAPYISGAYELALALDSRLRAEGKRESAPITFVTSEPYLGHFGYGQTAAQSSLEAMFRERNIVALPNVAIERVTDSAVALVGGRSIEVALSVIMPPMTGAVDIWKSAGLTDADGLIAVTSGYQHTRFPNIYAAGNAAYFAQPVSPLEGGRVPLTGYLATYMGRAAAENVAASLGCGAPASSTLPALIDVRVIDGGDAGLVVTAWGKDRLRSRAVTLPGSTSHLLKGAIERYELWRLRTGRAGGA
jgi:sulfide:quinone oxidoreductase